jgi:hypothetical protein
MPGSQETCLRPKPLALVERVAPQVKILSRGLLAAACATALTAAPAAAAGPANVTLRAEGKSQTVVPRTAVRTDTRTVNKDGDPSHNCTGTSVAGALEIATAGDWGVSGWFDGFGYFLSRIKGEQPTGNDFLSLWVNDKEAQQGVCGIELQEGDEVLFFVARCDYDSATQACTNPPVRPLDLRDVPGRAAPGAPFNVRVVELAPNGTPSPVAGATVTGGDAPATTNAEGVATVRVSARGAAGLLAEKENRARTAVEPVCVTDGADGFCGTTTPSGTTVQPAPAGTTTAATRDRTPPTAVVEGIREGQVFARGSAPRVLRGQVGEAVPGARAGLRPDPSGLHAVKLRLTRTDAGRCTTFSKSRERFVRRRCGAARGYWFVIGDRADWEYQLPERLPRGRYVLDVNAIDKAFNRDDVRKRGVNRVVFRVR